MNPISPVLEFFGDPADFLEVADEFLASDPLRNTVVATVTRRCADGEMEAGPFPRWWVTVRPDPTGSVEAVGMRTAPGTPSPPYLTAMSEAAAVLLARALVDRGEILEGVNGAMESAEVVARETARLIGGSAEVYEHTRLHALRELIPARPTEGHLRLATPADTDLCVAWWKAFEIDAALQAGRIGEAHSIEPQDAGQMLARIGTGRVWLWENQGGEVVHLTGANPPAYGVARVGPVYTPAEHRGHGYASATVGEVSQLLLDQGAQACLFTDQANPVSNRIYAALGYEPVEDMVNMTIRRAITTPAPA